MMSLPDFNYKQIIFHMAGGNGERLRFLADTIVIEDKEGKRILRHSCHKLFALFIVGEMSLTSVAIRQALRFNFPIILMSGNFRIITRINSAAEGNTLLRMKQYLAGERNMETARSIIAQKIANQASLLRALRYRSAEDNNCLQTLEQMDLSEANDVHSLMGLEGYASKLFFSAYFRQLGWKRREPRCKHDIPNLLLDIGYTYLFNFIESMLCLYGFDLYCGVHHTFFYHRKSLVCDIEEPFRYIIDRRLRKAHNLKQIDPNDFLFAKESFSLIWKKQKKYIELFFKDILEEKERIFLYVRDYYRWFIRDMPIEKFPSFDIMEA